MKIVFSIVFAALLAPTATWALTPAQTQEVVKELDRRSEAAGDYKALTLIEQKQRGKSDLAYQAVVYRRDKADRFMILFTKPRSEAGKGYLRIDRNMFMYDPSVGKWERRTERERIMGTDTRRGDLDEWRLSEEYKAEYIKEAKLGRFKVHHIKLKAKKDARVAYPELQIWVDIKSGNLLKRQDFALSGRLMRTAYYPKWKKLTSPDGKAVYYPVQMRVFDEVEKGNKTTIAITQLDLRALPLNIFTKAWLESKSR